MWSRRSASCRSGTPGRPSAENEHAQVGILVHGGGELVPGIGVVVAHAVVPRLHAGQDFIGQIVLKFQFPADITVDRRRKRPVKWRRGGIEIRVGRRRVVVASGDAGIVSAEDQSLIVEQLLRNTPLSIRRWLSRMIWG